MAEGLSDFDTFSRDLEIRRLRLSLILLLCFGFASAADTANRIDSNLTAAVAKVDITPPPGTKVVGHVRETSGVRDRLHANVLLLHDGKTRAA